MSILTVVIGLVGMDGYLLGGISERDAFERLGFSPKQVGALHEEFSSLYARLLSAYSEGRIDKATVYVSDLFVEYLKRSKANSMLKESVIPLRYLAGEWELGFSGSEEFTPSGVLPDNL